MDDVNQFAEEVKEDEAFMCEVRQMMRSRIMFGSKS